MPDNFPYSFYVDYLNRPDIQAAIGAYTNFTDSSAIVFDDFSVTGDVSREDSTIEDVKRLVDDGLYVVTYVGDADYNCNWLGGQVVAGLVGAPNFDKAGFTDLQASDSIVHGQVKQASNFAFVRIYYSGHEVPFYQPLAALELFERTLTRKDLATGQTDLSSGLLTQGPATSDFREGNATVQFEILPANSTYNTTTGAPNPPSMEKRAFFRSDGGRMEKPRRDHRKKAAKAGRRTARSLKLF